MEFRQVASIKELKQLIKNREMPPHELGCFIFRDFWAGDSGGSPVISNKAWLPFIEPLRQDAAYGAIINQWIDIYRVADRTLLEAHILYHMAARKLEYLLCLASHYQIWHYVAQINSQIKAKSASAGDAIAEELHLHLFADALDGEEVTPPLEEMQRVVAGELTAVKEAIKQYLAIRSVFLDLEALTGAEFSTTIESEWQNLLHLAERYNKMYADGYLNETLKQVFTDQPALKLSRLGINRLKPDKRREQFFTETFQYVIFEGWRELVSQKRPLWVILEEASQETEGIS